jgi:hypothetical protein
VPPCQHTKARGAPAWSGSCRRIHP